MAKINFSCSKMFWINILSQGEPPVLSLFLILGIRCFKRELITDMKNGVVFLDLMVETYRSRGEGKKIMSVGESSNLNQFDSPLCLRHAAGPHVRTSSNRNGHGRYWHIWGWHFWLPFILRFIWLYLVATKCYWVPHGTDDKSLKPTRPRTSCWP